jgi:hypothetical protein
MSAKIQDQPVALPQVLRRISSKLSLYAFQTPTPRTASDPDAFTKAFDELDALATSAETMAKMIVRNELRKNALLLLLNLRQMLERPALAQWSPTGRRGRSDDELMHNRPAFQMADDALSTDLHDVADLVEIELADFPPKTSNLPTGISAKKAAVVLGVGERSVHRMAREGALLRVQGGVDAVKVVELAAEKMEARGDPVNMDKAAEAREKIAKQRKAKAQQSEQWRCSKPGCGWSGEFPDNSKCPDCGGNIEIIATPHKRQRQ